MVFDGMVEGEDDRELIEEIEDGFERSYILENGEKLTITSES